MVTFKDAFGNEFSTNKIVLLLKKGFKLVENADLFSNQKPPRFLTDDNFEGGISNVYIIKRGKKPKKYINQIDDFLKLYNGGERSIREVALIKNCSTKTVIEIIHGKYLQENPSAPKITVAKENDPKKDGYVTLQEFQVDFSFFPRDIYEYYVNLTNRIKNNSSHKIATKNVTTTKEKLYGLGHVKFFKRLLPYGPYGKKITCEEFEEAMKELLIKKYAYRCLDPVPIYMVRQGRNQKNSVPSK